MKQKSIEFPPSNYECQVPIHTPQRSVRAQAPANHISLYQQNALAINQLPTNPVQINQNSGSFPIVTRMTGPIALNDEQLAKLKSELEIVNGNTKVFDEMLTELDKSKNLQAEDLELLHELNATCMQMQRRIVELIDKISNEEITSELLMVNDNLNTLFARYEVYSVRRRLNTTPINNQPFVSAQIANNQPPPPPPSSPSPASNQAANVRPRTNQEEASLIDLRETNTTSSLEHQLDALQLGAVGGGGNTKQPQLNSKSAASKQSGDTDFDEFAQLRSTEKQAPRFVDGVELATEEEAKEMEKFLNFEFDKEANGEAAPASLSNTEFDRFLESRFNNLDNNQQSPKKSSKPSADLL